MSANRHHIQVLAAGVRAISHPPEMLLPTMLEAGVAPDTTSYRHTTSYRYRHILEAFANVENISRVAVLI